jgi:tRNA G46 methylase TrmB
MQARPSAESPAWQGVPYQQWLQARRQRGGLFSALNLVWSSARRRYLVLEFPALARRAPPLLVAELGCGCGASLLPVLKANPAARALATDLSPAAVRRRSGR